MKTVQPAKGGSLNDQLAIERTIMANDRTLLSFIRTTLYLVVAGLTLTQFISEKYGGLLQVIFFVLAAFTLAMGLYKYRQQMSRIRQSRKYINSQQFPATVESL
jgi:putative membrane protein